MNRDDEKLLDLLRILFDEKLKNVNIIVENHEKRLNGLKCNEHETELLRIRTETQVRAEEAGKRAGRTATAWARVAMATSILFGLINLAFRAMGGGK